MNAKTSEFLAKARELGVTVVGIGDTRHPMLKNESFPFHQRNQLFSPDARLDGWPVVWELARRAGIYSGCGNTGQCQADTTELTHGVYVQLMGGEWGRVA